MKRVRNLMLMAMVALTMSAATEYPAGSGIYYDFDEDGVCYVHWVDGDVNLGDVVIPATVTIDGYDYTPMYFGQWTDKFWGNTTITSLTIEAPIPEISGWKFQNCSNLKWVKLNEGMTTIGEQAFSNCTSLEEVIFSETMTTIGQAAFWGDPIVELNFPASLDSIGGWCFGDNAAMTSATFNGVPRAIADQIFTWDEEAGYSNFFVCCSYWNARALIDVMDVANGGLQYKVWDAMVDETWNNNNYLVKAYTDELTVKRTLKANTWTAITLPVWLSAEQVAEAFGDGTQVAEFTGVNGDKFSFATLDLSDEVGMEANKPYLIKTPEAMTETTIPYVWLSDDFSAVCDTIEGNILIGTYNGYDGTIPEDALYLVDGELVKSNGTDAATGLSGYFIAVSPDAITGITVDGESDERTEGDINGDGYVNTGDISEEYIIILGRDLTNAKYADVNKDGFINISDVSEIYKIILK